MAIEPCLAEMVTMEQRGFIGGRSMIANPVDVDEALMLAVASNNSALGLFYDFKAAFPSVEHLILLLYFKALGWPPWVCRIISCLYARNFCHISLGGAMHMGFVVTRGIRQGCPLSPLFVAFFRSQFYVASNVRSPTRFDVHMPMT